MRYSALIVVLACCSSAAAAPVLITKDNYQSAADSPFDLSQGYLEDFDDGLVNTPGVSPLDQYRFSAGGVGGGKAIEPRVVVQTLDGLTNMTAVSFVFDEPYPTQVGFVTTQADFPARIVSILTLPVNLNPLVAPFAPNRFFGVTDPDGIQAIQIGMAIAAPGEPFFQIDDFQYVPEPSGLALLVIGLAFVPILMRFAR